MYIYKTVKTKQNWKKKKKEKKKKNIFAYDHFGMS